MISRDPARFEGPMVEYILPRLGAAQRRVVDSLGANWGPASCHRTARRMFYGVTDRHYTVVQHKHLTDNCWRLTSLGLALKAAIAIEAGTGETTQIGSTEGESAGLNEASPNPSHPSSNTQGEGHHG